MILATNSTTNTALNNLIVRILSNEQYLQEVLTQDETSNIILLKAGSVLQPSLFNNVNFNIP